MWKTWTGNDQMSAPVSSAKSAGAVQGPGGWHPTVIYLLVLIVAEILVAGLLARTVLR